MIEVEKIIKILDEELVSLNKSYFTLQQANKILIEKGIFQDSDVLDKTLKGLLEEQKITNANRTLHEPKQWRIHHSGKIYKTEASNLKEIDIVETPKLDFNSEKVTVICPSCGNPIDKAHYIETKTFLKCKNCSNIFHNPLSKNILFSEPIESKIKYVFENHGLKIIIGIAIVVLISLIYFKTNDTVYWHDEPRKLTEKEKRTEKLISLATDVFHENEWCYNQWAFLSSIKSAEDSYYGNSDVKIDFHLRALPNNGILLYTTKIILPSQELYSKKDPVYGLPLYFFYRFYFDDKDNLTAKYLIVVYDSDKSVTYDFKTRPVQRLINYKLALFKMDKWEKHKKQMAAQQKRDQNQKQEQTNTESQQTAPTDNQSSLRKVFKFKSENYDIEKPGETGYTTVNDPSYHIVDFNNMAITQTSLIHSKWVEISYSIRSFYLEQGAINTTYILVINSKGLKEVWFSPEVSNLGYDYFDGTRIACYDLSVIR